jgi:hypothetical protein
VKDGYEFEWKGSPGHEDSRLVLRSLRHQEIPRRER